MVLLGHLLKVLKLYDVNNPPLNTGATEYIDLSSYSGVIKIGFYATTTVSNADYNVYIDNFKVRTTPLCPEPSANTATGITSTDATLSWIENGIATDYKVEYILADIPRVLVLHLSFLRILLKL